MSAADVSGTAVLLLSCLDQRGIVAAVSGFLAEKGVSIVHAEQHADSEAGIFFQRVEFELEGLLGTVAELKADFLSVAVQFGIDFSLHLSTDRPRVAILCSQQGHCLYDLLARWGLGEMPGELALVASNHATHQAVVERSGTPYHHLPVDPNDRPAQQRALLDLLADSNVDLVVMARYMQILPRELIDAFPHRIVNIHHSFLPAFPGGRPYHQAHARGVKLIGATGHYATADLDEGPIIEQDVSRVNHRHSPAELVRRGRDLEMVVLARAVRAHLDHRVLVYGNKTVVFG
jgi:formyltetrahydrofolate deformylase